MPAVSECACYDDDGLPKGWPSPPSFNKPNYRHQNPIVDSQVDVVRVVSGKQFYGKIVSDQTKRIRVSYGDVC